MFFMAEDGNGAQALFWGLVTVVVIISQILKTGKNKAPTGQGAEDGGKEAAGEAPSAEALENFLQGLQGGVVPQEKARGRSSARRGASFGEATGNSYSLNQGRKGPPRARQAPPAPSSRAGGAAVRQPSASARRRRPGRMLGGGSTAFPARGRQTYASDARPSASGLPTDIARGLSGQSALRKAVVLREILGPPVAMRGPACDGF